VNQFEQRLRQEFPQVNTDLLTKAMQVLPPNYNYEVHKTVLKVM